MKYAVHLKDTVHGSFSITIDDETMTWVSNPPGHDLPQDMVGAHATKSGTPGPGKTFDLFRGGKATLHKG